MIFSSERLNHIGGQGMQASSREHEVLLYLMLMCGRLCMGQVAGARNMLSYGKTCYGESILSSIWPQLVACNVPGTDGLDQMKKALEAYGVTVSSFPEAWCDFAMWLSKELADIDTAPPRPPWLDIPDDAGAKTVLGIHSGLGNQLFQYAGAKAWSRSSGTPLFIDVSTYLREPRIDRQFMLPHFHAKYEVANDADITRAHRRIHQEHGFYPDPTPFFGRGGVFMVGFWERECYMWDDVLKAELKKDFSLRDGAIMEYAQNYVERLRRKYGRPVVGVHVRMGDNNDYSNHFRTFIPIRSDYFTEALSDYSDVTLLCFTDTLNDSLRCEKNMTWPKDCQVVYSRGHSDIFDFCLMQACDHLIISPSTFSWWAAWLSEREGRRVTIAHRNWVYGQLIAYSDTDHFSPHGWKVIPYRRLCQ